MKTPARHITAKGDCYYVVHHTWRKKKKCGWCTLDEHNWDKKIVAKCKSINRVEMQILFKISKTSLTEVSIWTFWMTMTSIFLLSHGEIQNVDLFHGEGSILFTTWHHVGKISKTSLSSSFPFTWSTYQWWIGLFHCLTTFASSTSKLQIKPNKPSIH